MFTLHPQLAKDCHVIGQFPLCKLLLMNDANYPWFILVPMQAGIREIYELSAADQQQFLQESSELGKGLMQVFSGDKLNIGALGNVVPQLHIHVIGRQHEDYCWPGVVWGRPEKTPYTQEAINHIIAKVKNSSQININLMDKIIESTD